MDRKYGILVGTLLLSAAAVPVFGWHFHGGSVEDIQNRIKQALETAKQSEIYTQYKTMTENYQKVYAAWKEMDASARSLWDEVDGSIVKKPLSAMLGKDGDLEDILEERTKFNLLSEGGNVASTRKDNVDRLKNIHQQEFINTIDAANNTEAVTNAAVDEAHAVTASIPSEGMLAVQQKNAVLTSYEGTVSNANDAVLAQEAVGDWSLTALRGNLETEAGLYAKEQEMYMPDADSPLLQQEVKKVRIRELPR